MTYHLHYYSTDLKVRTLVALTELGVYGGFKRVRKNIEPCAIPLYMVIKEDNGKSYYIPQDKLFDDLDLNPHTEKTNFLFLCAENGYFNTEFVYYLSQEEVVCWELTDQQKNILDTLGMHYFMIDPHSEENYYQIEY